jgi:hypothetical protein
MGLVGSMVEQYNSANIISNFRGLRCRRQLTDVKVWYPYTNLSKASTHTKNGVSRIAKAFKVQECAINLLDFPTRMLAGRDAQCNRVA